MSLMQLLWSFQGRIGRGQFWKGILIIIGLWLLISIVAGGVDAATRSAGPNGGMGVVASIIALIGFIAAVVAQLAVEVKRFHDRGKSGWWVLIALVPLIGAIWILVELGCLEGDQGPNAYGPNPVPTV